VDVCSTDGADYALTEYPACVESSHFCFCICGVFWSALLSVSGEKTPKCI